MKYIMDSKEILEREYLIQEENLNGVDIVILYGNSIIACILKTALIELGYNGSIYIFDKGKFINNDNQNMKLKDTVVYLCSSRKSTRESMIKDAKKFFPRSNVYDFFAVYFQWISQVIKRNCDYNVLAETLFLCRKDECIFNIDSINTLYCNLKCKECSNGIQFRKNKKVISADSQVYHLSKMTDKMPICQCNFQGGEVFTDVRFGEFVLKHSYNPRVAIFTIATNGTILPSDSLFKVIKETGCMIRISDYGFISQKKHEIIKKCEEFKIPCFIFPMSEQWRKFGDYYKRNRDEEELKIICKKCCFGTHDLMFIDNKIFCCLRTLFADAVSDDSEAVRENTLDLDSDFTIEELEEFINGKKLWMMCDYCDSNMKIIEPGEQM